MYFKVLILVPVLESKKMCDASLRRPPAVQLAAWAGPSGACRPDTPRNARPAFSAAVVSACFAQREARDHKVQRISRLLIFKVLPVLLLDWYSLQYFRWIVLLLDRHSALFE